VSFKGVVSKRRARRSVGNNKLMNCQMKNKKDAHQTAIIQGWPTPTPRVCPEILRAGIMCRMYIRTGSRSTQCRGNPVAILVAFPMVSRVSLCLPLPLSSPVACEQSLRSRQSAGPRTLKGASRTRSLAGAQGPTVNTSYRRSPSNVHRPQRAHRLTAKRRKGRRHHRSQRHQLPVTWRSQRQ
jgi:hypothetical protein